VISVKIRPLGYRLIVKPEAVEEKVGNIYIPDEAKDQKQWKQSRGMVVAIGELAFTTGTPNQDDFIVFPGRPQKGDTVMFREYAGYAWKDEEGNKYVTLNDDDVMGVEAVND
jgi:co-chaperonin GroES (HSP10)